MSDFQWIVDRADSISINRKKMVGVTTARDGITRAVSRGTLPKTFTIKVADGIPWTELRTLISAAEALDRISTATITITYATHPWYYGNTAPSVDDVWTVRCTVFPEWSISARNQVSWSGAFVFQEVI